MKFLGYIKLYRSTYDHHLFRNEPYSKRDAWHYLIAEAAFKPWTKYVREIPVKIGRGQAVISIRDLAKEWRWSKDKVTRFLIRLEDDAMIRTQKSQLGNQYTIVNYEKYQADKDINKDIDKDIDKDKKEEVKEDVKNKDKNKEDVFSVRPEFVSEEDWKALILHRRGHKQKPKETEYAYRILAGKIKKTMELGFTSTEVIEQIVVRNWQSVEPSWMPENKPTKGGAKNVRDERSDILGKAARHVLAQRINEASNG